MTMSTLALCLIRHKNTFFQQSHSHAVKIAAGHSKYFWNSTMPVQRLTRKKRKEIVILHTEDRLINANGRATDQVLVIVYKEEHVTLHTETMFGEWRKKMLWVSVLNWLYYVIIMSENQHEKRCVRGRSEWRATWPCATKLIDNTQRNGICNEFRHCGEQKKKMICEFHTSCPRVVLLLCRLPRLDALWLFYFISLNAKRWWILRTAFNSNYCDMNDLCTVVQLLSMLLNHGRLVFIPI